METSQVEENGDAEQPAKKKKKKKVANKYLLYNRMFVFYNFMLSLLENK